MAKHAFWGLIVLLSVLHICATYTKVNSPKQVPATCESVDSVSTSETSDFSPIVLLSGD